MHSVALTENPRVKHSRICLFLMTLIFLSGLVLGFEAAAEPDSGRIDQVKAAFVLNIARFVSWPPDTLSDPNKRLLLCLYRRNPINQAIDILAGELVSGRRIEISRIQNLAESAPCNILLIAHSELPAYQKEVGPGLNRPLLTIADLTSNATLKSSRHDILVTLVRNGSRIGFEINLNKTRQLGLRMSSELLKLATIVGDDT
ncbi:MAG: YfiR family protein [Gammaproteobacteria bacterium]